MSTRSVVLASASSARLRLLTDAGLAPEVVVSGVDEDALELAEPREHVLALAVAKAEAVAARRPEALVLGCDSMLLFAGDLLGKAASPEQAAERWRRWRGREGSLLTGHCVIDGASGRRATGVGATTIRFGRPSDAEICVYAQTAEATAVAGPFTIDGRAAAFVDSIDGDAGNVIGLSLPLLRSLLAELGVELTDLWR